ncbi:MAG TPA: polyprenyl synthetase family protein [Thermoplasmata archaeon]|nr:polyprenyl synthetase family protein [Thermoplasmata archaeon]
MNLVDLRGYVPAIEAHLARAYRGRARTAPRGLVEPIGLMREFTLRGGKRFRAQFVLAGYYLATGRPPTPAVPAAAAMEHFQSWMLIHDDVIDHSELRRGGPTLHRALERRHRARRREGDAVAIGQGLGITLGDLEEPLTVSALLDSPVPKERVLAAVREYARMTALTAYGQVLDIDNGARPLEELRESDVLLVHRLKSAVYTVASPLRIGAILGGGSPGLLAGLERFGLDAGIAFQLRDDVLGAGFGSSAIGKSANDLVEGKRTLLVVRA